MRNKITADEVEDRYTGGTLDILGITIGQDEDAESPRDWDNLGHMVCFHKRYNLGDKHDLRSEDYDGWDALEEFLVKEREAAVILPLYLYDHSGVTIRTGPFSCPWDSGQVGFIYATRAEILAEYNRKRLTKKRRAQVQEYLIGEVEVYDQYLRGDVYYWRIEVDDYEDSCGGIYGIDYVFKEVADNYNSAIAQSETPQPA